MHVPRIFTAVVVAAAVSAAWNSIVVPRAMAQPAASVRSSLIVTTSWLAQHLKDPDLVLLHVGDKAEYDAKHIPGARFVTMNMFSTPHADTALMLEMPALTALQNALATLGISDRSRIVLYYGKDWVTPTTRIMLTLDYVGLGANSSILDGGMTTWIKDGNAVTDVMPAPSHGTLSALRTKPIIVDAEFVKAHLAKPGFKVIDGRAASFYDGIQTGGGAMRPHKTGHIAGAGSAPFTETTTSDLLWKSPADLQALFTKAGVKPGDTIIGYCHIGQQATAMLFAARSLGHPVLLFDGSFEDWSRRADFPVDNPSTKGKP